MMKQSVLLAQSPHIVVSTPGRLADHLRSTDTVMLDRIKFLVRCFSTVQVYVCNVLYDMLRYL